MNLACLGWYSEENGFWNFGKICIASEWKYIAFAYIHQKQKSKKLLVGPTLQRLELIARNRILRRNNRVSCIMNNIIIMINVYK